MMTSAGDEKLGEFLLSLRVRIIKMGGHQIGDDLFQDVCLKAVDEKCSDARWILRVARNRKIDHLRREKRQRQPPPRHRLNIHVDLGKGRRDVRQSHSPPILEHFAEATIDEASRKLELKEATEKINREVDRLPQIYGDIIRLGLHEGLTDQQIADRFRIPAETVRTRRMRALRVLKNSLQSLCQ